MDSNDDMDSFEENDDTIEQGHSTTYEKLVELVLQDADEVNASRGEILNKQERLSPEPDDTQISDEENLRSNSEEGLLITELRELRKAMKRSLDHNAQLLKTSNATHEQLLITLDSLDKRDEEKMEIKRKKLEKQDELLQQVKIQNSLIAKLIQKIGNSGTTR